MSGPVFSEEEVIGRIDAFRRRRPRLKDEIITLAHGAGGKSSAALVDAVFVEAFGNELGDGAVLTAPGGRLWFQPGDLAPEVVGAQTPAAQPPQR